MLFGQRCWVSCGYHQQQNVRLIDRFIRAENYSMLIRHYIAKLTQATLLEIF